MKTLHFFLLFALFTACSTEKVIPDISSSFALKYGHTAILTDGDLSLKFIEVVQDSRCPEGAECIWAGNVTIQLAASLNGGALTDTLTLDLGPDNMQNERNPVGYDPYTINLISVTPYPKVDKNFDIDRYTLELMVEQ